MTQDEFEFLVNSLELDASIRPRVYKARLAALAVLGYAYVVGVVVLLGGLLATLIFLIFAKHSLAYALGKFVIALVVLIYVVARSMWVRLDPPKGRRVTAAEFPELFKTIEDVRTRASAPLVHEVLITSEFNAAVVQHPRLGLFGWPRNYLILGLPLLHGLQLDEFTAVLAHEFGHLSGAHGKFGAWIYRLRLGWLRLGHALSEQQHWGSALFAKFFSWYLPKFNAYSFVQARQQEYDADAISAAVASPRAAASALLRVNMQASFLDEKFWPAMFKRTHDAPEPTVTPFALMDQALRRPMQAEYAQRYIDDSMRRRTGFQDTHPCLTDRLSNLGVKPEVAPINGPTAAQYLLGKSAFKLRDEFDRQWQRDVKSWWAQRHGEVNTAKLRLAELDMSGKGLSVDECFERARLAEEFESSERALERYRAVLEVQPGHAGARFAHGRMLLERNDAAGVTELDNVMSHDVAATQPACELIVAFYRRNGRDSLSKPFLERYWKRQETLDAAEEERRRFAPNETYLRHDLPPGVLKELLDQLSNSDSLLEAYLVRKQVRELPEVPCYALFVLAQAPWWKFSSDPGAALVEELSKSLRVDIDLRIVSLNSDGKQYLKAVRRVPSAQVAG